MQAATELLLRAIINYLNPERGRKHLLFYDKWSLAHLINYLNPERGRKLVFGPLVKF